MYTRQDTRPVVYGGVKIGGGAPISIQSMTNTPTVDPAATIDQICALQEAGCQLVRLAVPDQKSAAQISKIKAGVKIPLIADIHFNYKLALSAIDGGIAALRLNPGNLEKPQHVALVAQKAAHAGVPIRIGVNAGSLAQKYQALTPQNMVASAYDHIKILEDHNFRDIVVSLKASDVLTTIASYRLFAQNYTYPLHIGLTEAGTLLNSAIKTSLGLGVLLYAGLGDTIRVSITGDPVKEVLVAKKILANLELGPPGLNIVSCPTCARTQVNVEQLATEVEAQLGWLSKPLTIAIMGCVVNGPGEASHADIGLAGGKGNYTLFKKGKILGRYPENEAKKRLLAEIEAMVQ